ncbi:MAG: GNAT family N-acetyltransferase [Rikenellaceae bacterium]|nr:GNAT family N-acetyltransferase [Rikenellaceae bacterium]
MPSATERLIFRELTISDERDLYEMLHDPRVMYAYEHTFTQEEVRTWLWRQQMRYLRDGIGLWALVDRTSGEMVGQAGLTLQRTDREEAAEIGYLLKYRHWHRGYASEAASACRDLAFGPLGLRRVISVIRSNNHPSQRVALRTGMSPEYRFTKYYYGVKMPHTVYAAYRNGA